MKTQKLLHAARAKQTQERAAESDKPRGNSKAWRLEKQWTHMEVKHTQGIGTTYMYQANIEEVGHGSKVRKGVVWQWREGGAYFGVPAQALLGKMFC